MTRGSSVTGPVPATQPPPPRAGSRARRGRAARARTTVAGGPPAREVAVGGRERPRGEETVPVVVSGLMSPPMTGAPRRTTARGRRRPGRTRRASTQAACRPASGENSAVTSQSARPRRSRRVEPSATPAVTAAPRLLASPAMVRRRTTSPTGRRACSQTSLSAPPPTASTGRRGPGLPERPMPVYRLNATPSSTARVRSPGRGAGPARRSAAGRVPVRRALAEQVRQEVQPVRAGRHRGTPRAACRSGRAHGREPARR